MISFVVKDGQSDNSLIYFLFIRNKGRSSIMKTLFITYQDIYAVRNEKDQRWSYEHNLLLQSLCILLCYCTKRSYTLLIVKSTSKYFDGNIRHHLDDWIFRTNFRIPMIKMLVHISIFRYWVKIVCNIEYFLYSKGIIFEDKYIQ